MRNTGWVVVAVGLLLTGCTSPAPAPSPSPTTAPIPADIEDFLAASVAGDIEGVRERLAIWNEDAGRNLKPTEISTECATDEATAVATQVNNPALTAYVYTGTGIDVWVVRFESENGANKGWGIEQGEGGWYWQPQSASCQALWNSPSPEPS